MYQDEVTGLPQPAQSDLRNVQDEESGTRLLSFLIVTAVVSLTTSVVIVGWIMGGAVSGGHGHAGLRPPTKSAAVSSAGSHGSRPGNPQHGQELFGMTCIACHGPTGAGIPHLGANLRESKFVASKNDDELVAFIKHGRQPGDPNSVLGLTMPPKGGNPALDDASLHDIVAFIRTLQAQERSSASASQ